MNNKYATNTIEERQEIFFEKLVTALKEYYGDEYKVMIGEVKKNNGLVLHGLTIANDNERITPNIYVDSFFERYEVGDTFSDIVREIIDIRDKHGKICDFNVDFFEDYNLIKDKLGVKIINMEMNRELLKDTPYKEYMDMAVVFVVFVVSDLIGEGTILIKEEHLKLWKIDVDTLYEDALQNMEIINPPYLRGMLELMKELYISRMGNIDNEDIISELMEPALRNMRMVNENSCQMHVLTNTSKCNGASTILYKGLLKKVSREVGGDYYILPSSIHEVIVLPVGMGELEEENLSAMVREVNSQHVAREEVLSNHVYKYASKQDKLSLVAI